jgi:hypothetical protein
MLRKTSGCSGRRLCHLVWVVLQYGNVQERGVLYRTAVDLTHTRKTCNYKGKCRHLFKLMDNPSIGRYSAVAIESVLKARMVGDMGLTQ